MKYRCGFVSNSSSSSFVLLKDNLSKKQIEEFKAWINEVESEDNENYDEDTSICEEGRFFLGTVSYHCGIAEILEELKIDKNDWRTVS